MQLKASNIRAAILQYLKDQKVILEHEVQLTEHHISHFVGQVAYTYNLTGEHVRAAIGTVGMFPEELIDHLESILDRIENKPLTVLDAVEPEPLVEAEAQAVAVAQADVSEVTAAVDSEPEATVAEETHTATEEVGQTKPRTSKKKAVE